MLTVKSKKTIIRTKITKLIKITKIKHYANDIKKRNKRQ
jgi:hypothetical protein